MMSHHRTGVFRVFNFGQAIAAAAMAVACGSPAMAQTVRNYNVNRTATAPVIDGVVSPGEWNGAAAAAGSWGVLRETAADVDTENNRFRMLWDDANLYVLYQTDFGGFTTDADINNPKPNISFGGPDVLNLYIDPNEDGDLNFQPGVNPDNAVDGYQIAWNQLIHPSGGVLISTDDDRKGVGFFTEAHAGAATGDQARWNNGAVDVTGPALQDIVVAQNNGTGGGVAEVIIPFANLNALEFLPGITDASDFNKDGLVDGGDFLIWQRNLGPSQSIDNSTGDADFSGTIDEADLAIWEAAYGTNTQVETGLNAVEGPDAGDQWFFDMGRQNGLGTATENFLPIWNFNAGQGFAARPDGTITFVGPPAGAVPEPAAMGMISLAAAAIVAAHRRRRV